LDLGCGYGHFLSLAKTEGWQVEGVESSDYDSQIAKRQNNVVIHRDLNNTKLTRESFDVVTLWDTIEHILDINTVIKKIRGLLRPGGAILIKTPDARIFNYKKKLFPEIFIHFYRSYIYPSNPRQHIYHFNPEYLIDLLKNYGFDNFRVEEDELFSERIISGNNIFVRLVRLAFMQITWHMNLPFEFVLICEKKT
jgi:2-polyprenyl-3-methyl-5-hydroxy-6-metoxy-1,4-benzoquinol methylase